MVNGEMESCEIFIGWEIDPLFKDSLLRFILFLGNLWDVVSERMVEDCSEALGVVLERGIGESCIMALLYQRCNISIRFLDS